MKLELVPLMIYGDHVTYIVTEEGIANLLLFRIAKEWQLLAARSVKDLVSWSRGPVSAAG
jgi:Malonate decarboxylase, alpha subunit, transporter